MGLARQMKILVANNFRRWRIGFFALPVVLFASVGARAGAQVQPSGNSRRIPAADSKLIEVKVTGSQLFKQEEIAAASGLQVGATVDEEIFRKAARQLGETGAFSAISFSFTYSSAGTKLAFQVTDAEKFIPAHFVDFVWFSEPELLEKVHERVPLFSGKLPTTGRMPDQVSDVLQALLVENAIPGHVEYLRTPGAKGELSSVDYSVANVIIRIRHVEFTGAGAEELPLLEAAAEKLSGRDYSHTLLSSFTKDAVLPIYRDRGYLKVACSAPQPEVAKAVASDVDERQPVTLVDVGLAITSGLQYKLTGWNWTGNKNVPTNELQPLLHTKPGKPASTMELEDDLRTVQQLYGSRGYVTASIKADAQYDDGAETVAYLLTVSEGYLYHMGELEFRGIDNNLTARLRAAWKLRPGDVYDASYLKEFLPEAKKLLPSAIDWEVSPHVTAIAREKTVDVDLQYTARAPR
jgi:outer membrane protein assembly factor BamA